MSEKPVKVFISYSWDSEEHKAWVRKLSDDLEKAGIETILDQKDMELGDLIPEFMEKSVSESNYVLMVLTPTYTEKADNGLGGVGYEKSIITAEVYGKQNHRKFIPVLASGTWETSTPIWAKGKFGVDLNGSSYYSGIDTLIDSIFNNEHGAEKCVKQGDGWCRRGQYNHAIFAYSKAIKLNPYSASIFNSRGLAYCMNAQYEKAIEDFTNAINLDPEERDPIYAIVYNNRGNAYFYKEKDALDYLNIISDYRDKEHYNSILSQFDSLCTNNGRSSYSSDSLERDYESVRHEIRSKYYNAENDYTRAIAINPGFTEAYINRGYLYYCMQNYYGAIEDYTKAIELDPDFALAYKDRAKAYSANNSYIKAWLDRNVYDKLIKSTSSLFSYRGVNH